MMPQDRSYAGTFRNNTYGVALPIPSSYPESNSTLSATPETSISPLSPSIISPHQPPIALPREGVYGSTYTPGVYMTDLPSTHLPCYYPSGQHNTLSAYYPHQQDQRQNPYNPPIASSTHGAMSINSHSPAVWEQMSQAGPSHRSLLDDIPIQSPPRVHRQLVPHSYEIIPALPSNALVSPSDLSNTPDTHYHARPFAPRPSRWVEHPVSASGLGSSGSCGLDGAMYQAGFPSFSMYSTTNGSETTPREAGNEIDKDRYHPFPTPSDNGNPSELAGPTARGSDAGLGSDMWAYAIPSDGTSPVIANTSVNGAGVTNGAGISTNRAMSASQAGYMHHASGLNGGQAHDHYQASTYSDSNSRRNSGSIAQGAGQEAWTDTGELTSSGLSNILGMYTEIRSSISLLRPVTHPADPPPHPAGQTVRTIQDLINTAADASHILTGRSTNIAGGVPGQHRVAPTVHHPPNTGVSGVIGTVPDALSRNSISSAAAPEHTLSASVGAKKETVCLRCGKTDTPEWRKGPLGPRTLCNACGLQVMKKEKKERIQAEKAAAAAAAAGTAGAAM